MKLKALFSLFLAASIVSNGQTQNSPFNKIYLEAGGGAASHNGVFAVAGASFVLKNNWTVAASYHNLDMAPKNLPSDYKRGYTILYIFPVPDEWPSVNVNMINVTAGKFFQSGRKTWFTTEAGLSVASGETMKFTRQQVQDDGFYHPSNYSIQKQSKTAIGGIVKAGFNWAFTPYLGLGIGGFAGINSVQSAAGLEFKLIAGWLNTKRK